MGNNRTKSCEQCWAKPSRMPERWLRRCLFFEYLYVILWTLYFNMHVYEHIKRPLILFCSVLFSAAVSLTQKLVLREELVTHKCVQDALDLLRGAVTIVYPMGLPPHDVIQREFENTEDLSGTQASLEVCSFSIICLFCLFIHHQHFCLISSGIQFDFKARSLCFKDHE